MLKSAKYWIEKLELQPHPEGGSFRETYRSQEIIRKNDQDDVFPDKRNFSTAIFYLLQNNEFSSWHRIKSDEMWHFYQGTTAIEIHMLTQEGHRVELLGNNPEKDENLQICVPAKTWFAAHLTRSQGFALVGCTVAPGFDFSDFELAKQTELLTQFPEQIEIINQFIR